VIAPDPYIIISALFLDLALGDPRWLPHPVALIGRLITKLELLLRPELRSEGLSVIAKPAETRDKVAGILLLLITVASAAGAAWLLLFTASLVSGLVEFLLAVAISWTCLAARSLHGESAVVADALAAGEIEKARHSLSYIVGRDTADLNEPEIWRALVETVAENSSDGIIAPLFWLTVGGPVAAMAFKAVSTLDSMVGYRNQRYLHFGWASARMDDLLNFIPARLTSLLMIISALPVGLSMSGAFRITLRDRLKHPSPNSAHPEAAAAGALGVQLGGISNYAGVASIKQHLGDPHLPLDRRAYSGMIRLMYASTLLMTAVCIATLVAIK
jgi:adenosylcobinamide-phosphate synthase